MSISDTLLIWYNPDKECYETGQYQTYNTILNSSRNGDRFEVVYEFCFETIQVADKILKTLNLANRISSSLNR